MGVLGLRVTEDAVLMDESQEGDQRAAPGRDAEPAGPHAAVGGLAAVL